MGKVFSVDRFPAWLVESLAAGPPNAVSVRVSVAGDDRRYSTVFVGPVSQVSSSVSDLASELSPATRPKVRLQWYAEEGGAGPIIATKDATFKATALASAPSTPVGDALLKDGLAVISAGTQRMLAISDRQEREVARLMKENAQLRALLDEKRDEGSHLDKAKGEALLRLMEPGVESISALRLWALRQGTESETGLAVLLSLKGGGAELVRAARRGGASYADILERLSEAIDENERDKPAAGPVATPG